MKSRLIVLLFVACLALAMSACGTSDDATASSDETSGSTTDESTPDLPPGTDTFLSAAGAVGDSDGSNNNDDTTVDASEDTTAPGSAGEDGARDDSAVEEGDIYRVLDGSLVLNLNRWRGLQVIDFSDPDAPEIIGRAQLTGMPVEMYVVDDEAWVLLNNWNGYRASSVHAEDMGTHEGGVVLRVDLSDPMQPEVMSSSLVPGNIQRSRLVRSVSRGEAALYVAATRSYPSLVERDCETIVRERLRDQGHDDDEIDDMLEDEDFQFEYDYYCSSYRVPVEWESRTYVRSFVPADEGDGLRIVDSLELGGWVTDIQATPRMLMVASGHMSWWQHGQGSEVRLVDIGDTTGEMTLRGKVETEGRVFTQFNMDIHGDILRVVSGSQWGSRQGNFIQTWDISDSDNPEAVDTESFGFPDDDLFATIFLGNRAFFVTYEQVDPFHAFEITDEGYATERNEFIVSGFNNFFRAVHGERRLIGIGMNDEHGGSRAAVSLYDITDLDNEDPLVAREEVEMQWTWSEANWDHRAFSVLEDAADATAADGTSETGLILLPFSGYSDDYERHVSAVQVFTFSEDTLTRRGVMEHDSRVRRSFLADPDTSLAGNLSESLFSLFDLSDPDAPEARGRVALAPDYSHYAPLGDFAARVRSPGRHWYWYWYDYDHREGAPVLEIIRADGHPDVEKPLGTLPLDRVQDLRAFGDDHLLVISLRHRENNWRQQDLWIEVVDVSDPTNPHIVGTATKEDYSIDSWRWGYDCFYCWGYRPQLSDLHILGDHLVFVASKSSSVYDEDVERPRIERCRQTIETGDSGRYGWGWRCDAEDGVLSCTIHYGERTCILNLDEDEAEPECTEYGFRCDEVHDIEAAEHSFSCDEPDWSLLSEPSCRETTFRNSRYRTEHKLRLTHVDLSNPLSPTILTTEEVDDFGKSGTLLVDGDILYHSWAEEVEDDGRDMLRWFIQPWRIVDGELTAGVPLNTPGIAMAVADDMLVSEDRVWHGGQIRAALRISRIEDDRIVLVDSHLLRDRVVETVTLDVDTGLILVLHKGIEHPVEFPYSPFLGQPGQPTRNRVVSDIVDSRVSLFRFDRDGLDASGEIATDAFADLRMMVGPYALFQTRASYYATNGVLVMDVSDPEEPTPIAWHILQGWPQSMHQHGGAVIFPSWLYGLYRLDPSERNLLDR